jgi:hypothetical protein
MALSRKVPLQRKTPLKRGSWKSSPVASTDWRAQLRRGGIKTRNRRPTIAEGSKFIEACRGAAVVARHDNRLSSGKGMGLKARNDRTLPGCLLCHRWLDQGPAPRAEKFAAFDRGFARWEPVRARKMGIEVNQMEQTCA